MMIRVIPQDFPEGWMPSEAEQEYENKPDIDATGIHPDLMPEFYSRVGRIQGHLEAFATDWWIGDFAITIEKGLATFEGLISTYEDGIAEKLENIKSLAFELTSFEAEEFLVIFQVKNAIIFRGEQLIRTIQ